MIKETIIHVNRNVIQRNAKNGTMNPVCRVEMAGEKKARYAMEVIIDGPSKMVYNPKNPRKCGAKLWIETDAPVKLVGEKAYEDFE